MKKLIWFTKGQNDLLDRIRTASSKSNSEIVREAMKLYADKLGIQYSDTDIDAKDLRKRS